MSEPPTFDERAGQPVLKRPIADHGCYECKRRASSHTPWNPSALVYSTVKGPVTVIFHSVGCLREWLSRRFGDRDAWDDVV